MISEQDHLIAVQRQLERKRDGYATKIQEIDDAIAGLKGATALLGSSVEPVVSAPQVARPQRNAKRAYGEVARFCRAKAAEWSYMGVSVETMEDAAREAFGRLTKSDKLSVYNIVYRMQKDGLLPRPNGHDVTAAGGVGMYSNG